MCAQITKALKDAVDLTVCFVLLGSARIKASHKHVGEIDPSNFLVPVGKIAQPNEKAQRTFFHTK